jgi:MFS family permease
LVAKWAPTGERSSITTFIFSGAQVGTVLGITCSGLIADSLGWEAVFYIQGSLAVVVVAAWLHVVYDSPELHPRISAKEREYIKSSTFTPANKVCLSVCVCAENNRKVMFMYFLHAVSCFYCQALAVPWKSIATSVPCWALLVSTLGNNWAFYMLITQLPIYMKTILHFDMKSV